MTQQEFILDALKSNPIVPSSHFVNNGIYRYSARIFELRKQGHDIGWYFKMNGDRKTKTAMYFLKESWYGRRKKTRQRNS